MHASRTGDLCPHHGDQAGSTKKLIEVYSWHVERAEYCADCREAARQTDEPLGCAACEFKCPELLPENEDIWELWALSCTQWRAAGFSVVGLDYNAVFKLAEMYEIELTPAEFNKLRFLEARELARMAAKARREAEDKHGD